MLCLLFRVFGLQTVVANKCTVYKATRASDKRSNKLSCGVKAYIAIDSKTLSPFSSFRAICAQTAAFSKKALHRAPVHYAYHFACGQENTVVRKSVKDARKWA